MSNSTETREATQETFPIDINTADKMEQYLNLNENFSNNFYLEKGKEKDLIEELDENDQDLIYRGMSPNLVYDLMNGSQISVSPYRYENTGSVIPPAEDLQNATMHYSNAIPHGYDNDVEYNFLTAVGFDHKAVEGMVISGTGSAMAKRLAGAGDIESTPQNRELDLTIEGNITPESVMTYCFRFPDKKGFKTLVYRRKTGESPK